ncbi:hypothetical protein [Staphylococcus chromogenes]|uniref:hypothetical protein n=1 Tax=Staphylococcus chromogenes TaxID=46126 RepID=UPI000E676F3B|nr:hypothetical protein [Staphylococcus chromogenes]MCE4966065.1 hypothetical protein [Staphylococcus chromogenes]RIM07163.1 hypothetical protein BU680_08835 [Staphylococcus chromogenes]
MKKQIITTIATGVLFSALATPFVSTKVEGVTSNSQNAATNVSQSNNTETKEVSTYSEFVSSDGPVAIDPSNLTDKQMRSLGMSQEQIQQEKITTYAAQTKKWSKKIPKNKIQGGLNVGIGVAGIIGAFFSVGTSLTVSANVATVVNGVLSFSNAKGVIVGGTAEKKLVRDTPYQLPKKKWLYKATWAKLY